MSPRTHRLLLAGVACVLGVVGCGGGGGGGGGGGPPPVGNITLSGRITFDRPSRNADQTHNFSATQRLPARGVSVEVLRSPGLTVLATATADANGNYTATFASTAFVLRARARLLRASPGSYDFEVRDNTASGAVYVLDSSVITPTSNTMSVDLNAGTGWTGAGFGGARSAAAFAILDVAWLAQDLVHQAEAGLDMPALDFFWSPLNRAENPPAPCEGQPDPATGRIGTSFFLAVSFPAGGGCPAVPAGIYVLGDASGNLGDDPDEFDRSVIAHEFGHYYEFFLSRSDSMGGPHSLSSVLDFRVAMGEGWGNAFQGFVHNDSFYRDTFGASGANGFSFNMDRRSEPLTRSVDYSSEACVAEVLWDLFDPAGAPDVVADNVGLGFAPIHAVMRNEVANTPALTAIWVPVSALKNRFPAQQADINVFLNDCQISGSDDFALGESGPGGDPFAVPVYHSVNLGVPFNITSVNNFADSDVYYSSYNRQGARRYLRIVLPAAGGLTVIADGPNGADPDFFLYHTGVDQCPAGGACDGTDDSVSDGREDATFANLPAGTYTLEVYECSNLGERCRPGPPLGDTVIQMMVTQP